MKSSKVNWHAFGDESSFEHVVTYGIVGVMPERQRETELSLEAIKKRFGASATTPLHCRQMFTPAAKSRSGWSHLSDEEIKELILSFSREVDQLGIRRNVGIIYKSTAPKELPGVGSVKTPLPLGEKQLCTYAFAAAFGPVLKQTGAKGVKLWLDKETTKIDWWGKRRQAVLTREMTLIDDLGMNKVQPEVVSGSSSVMFEVADLLAYTVGKNRNTEHANDFFETVQKILAPAEAVFNWV